MYNETISWIACPRLLVTRVIVRERQRPIRGEGNNSLMAFLSYKETQCAMSANSDNTGSRTHNSPSKASIPHVLYFEILLSSYASIITRVRCRLLNETVLCRERIKGLTDLCDNKLLHNISTLYVSDVAKLYFNFSQNLRSETHFFRNPRQLIDCEYEWRVLYIHYFVALPFATKNNGEDFGIHSRFATRARITTQPWVSARNSATLAFTSTIRKIIKDTLITRVKRNAPTILAFATRSRPIARSISSPSPPSLSPFSPSSQLSPSSSSRIRDRVTTGSAGTSRLAATVKTLQAQTVNTSSYWLYALYRRRCDKLHRSYPTTVERYVTDGWRCFATPWAGIQ